MMLCKCLLNFLECLQQLEIEIALTISLSGTCRKFYLCSYSMYFIVCELYSEPYKVKIDKGKILYQNCE